MSQSFKLFRLQQLDSQIDRAQARLQEIEIALNDNRELQKAETKTRQISEKLEENRKALHRAEEEVKSQRLKIEQTESTLYGGKIRNPKELQDLQNEAAALKRYLEVLEDRQLEQMIIQEDLEKKYRAAMIEFDLARARDEVSKKDFGKEQSSLMQDVQRLMGERQASISTIPPADLAIYDQLRLQRRGVAVAQVTDTYCSACGSTLSSALLHAARNPNQITRCDSCGRILYIN